MTTAGVAACLLAVGYLMIGSRRNPVGWYRTVAFLMFFAGKLFHCLVMRSCSIHIARNAIWNCKKIFLVSKNSSDDFNAEVSLSVSAIFEHLGSAMAKWCGNLLRGERSWF